jgi:hypothetical protein
MLILSVGAHSSMGMSFSQFIDFYDKQATLSISEHPSLEDNLDTFVAMGGRYFENVPHCSDFDFDASTH